MHDVINNDCLFSNLEQSIAVIPVLIKLPNQLMQFIK